MDILGMGVCHPPTAITNKFLVDLDTGTNEEWLIDKIGIIERVTTLPLDYIKETKNADPRAALEAATMHPTDLGVQAAKEALAQAGVSLDEVGMVLCNCCNPRYTFPSQAFQIAERLGVDAPAYDVNTACPAFALHVDYINAWNPDELPEIVLCISTAALTQNVNYSDRTDGAIWGDGACAWLLSTKRKGKLSVLDTYFQADPTRCQAVVVDRYAYFHQDGRAVRDFSVRQTVRLLKRLETEFALDWSRDVFIGHQANRTMLEQVANNREIPPTNHWHNVTYLGNQAGAGAPATLTQRWEQLMPGQRIAVAVVGAGLSWGSVLLEVN